VNAGNALPAVSVIESLACVFVEVLPVQRKPQLRRKVDQARKAVRVVLVVLAVQVLPEQLVVLALA